MARTKGKRRWWYTSGVLGVVSLCVLVLGAAPAQGQMIDGRWLCLSESAQTVENGVLTQTVTTYCYDLGGGADGGGPGDGPGGGGPGDEGDPDPGGGGPGADGGQGPEDFPMDPGDGGQSDGGIKSIVTADCSTATSDEVAACYQRAGTFCNFYGAAWAGFYCRANPVGAGTCSVLAEELCKGLYEEACEGDRQLIEVRECEEAQRGMEYKKYKIELKTQH